MDLNSTVSAQRLHIGFFGTVNSGKSSLVNALTGQKLSIVSDTRGTTTDPVQKAMELLPLGPVVIIDTPGLDDGTELGKLRIERTMQMLRKPILRLLLRMLPKKMQRPRASLKRSGKRAYRIFLSETNVTLTTQMPMAAMCFLSAQKRGKTLMS